MRKLTMTLIYTIALTIAVGTAHAAQAPQPTHTTYTINQTTEDRTPEPVIVFKHGDISWLPALALKAGWPASEIPRLGQIILRESGGCPNRRGGDIVDADCNITGIAERTHRSDSGLLQINGSNYNPKRNKWAPICTQMKICTQEPLLDAFTNLKAGYLLFTVTGSDWSPWDPSQW